MSAEAYAAIIMPIIAAIAGWVVRVERKVAKIDEVHSDMKEVKESTNAIMWHLINSKNGTASTK